MKLDEFGRLENPVAESIEATLIGYEEKGREVPFIIEFRGRIPLGVERALMDKMATESEFSFMFIMEFLTRCMTDAGREVWEAMVERDDVSVDRTAIQDMFKAIVAVYAGRPTTKRSGSRVTGRTTAPTSTGATPARKRKGPTTS